MNADRAFQIRLLIVRIVVLLFPSMEVVVNGKSLGLYSYNDGFELDIPIQSSFMDIALRCNGMTFHIKLPIESQENYTCKLYYSAFSYYYYDL